MSDGFQNDNLCEPGPFSCQSCKETHPSHKLQPRPSLRESRRRDVLTHATQSHTAASPKKGTRAEMQSRSLPESPPCYWSLGTLCSSFLLLLQDSFPPTCPRKAPCNLVFFLGHLRNSQGRTTDHI